MKIHIPFTKYDVHISKRGINYVKDGNLVGFTDWMGDAVFTPTTPIMEEVYSTISNEFAKIDLRHVIFKNDTYKMVDSELNYLLTQRPNPFQSAFDFKYTMIYQLCKYGNAIAFINRDREGKVTSIVPIDCKDYAMGYGYQIGEDTVLLKYKELKTGDILLVDYRNVIHLRANPNDIFNGDLWSGSNYNRVMIDLIDASLNSLINELRENGTVRGIIQIGGAATGYARGVATRVMAGQEEKVTKQQEIINRIKATKGGILVLDAGEEWKTLGNPFSTTSTQDIDKYVRLLLQFYGINEKVVNGTATSDMMEVFFFKTIAPRIEQMIDEMNYKIFSKSAITRGNRIEYYRNPFEYIPTTVAIDVAYKGAMDTTVNERRRMIYKLPPIEGGDRLMDNKNFDEYNQGVYDGRGRPKKNPDEDDSTTVTSSSTTTTTTTTTGGTDE